MRFKDFEDDLRRACAGHPLQSWQHSEYKPFGDVVEELSHWAGFSPSNRATGPLKTGGLFHGGGAGENPFRNVRSQ